MDSGAISYKDMQEPKETINIVSDRTEIKGEEEEENMISSDFEIFIEECLKIEDEIDISLIKQFISLFSDNPYLPFEPILSTNFIDLLSTKIFSIQEENFDETSDEFLLLQSLKILLSTIAFKDYFMMETVIPFLIDIISNSNITENEEIIQTILDCILIISANNCINRYSIHQKSMNNYIENLWKIFNFYLVKNDENSRHICETLIEIYGTFYCNIEKECITSILDKLTKILLYSQKFPTFSIKKLKKISSFSVTNLKIMSENHCITFIQTYLIKLQRDYFKILPVIQQFEKEEEKFEIELAEFELFLREEILDEEENISFEKVVIKTNELFENQMVSISILNDFAENLIFTDFDSKLIFELIKNFDFIRSPDLYAETVHFLVHSAFSFLPFSEIFRSDFQFICELIQNSENSFFKGKIESCLLFAKLIRNENKEFISALIDQQIVSLIIRNFCELNDSSIFNEISEILLKLIDFGFGEKIENDLQGIYEYVEEKANECENEENVQWRCKLLLDKIKFIVEKSEAENE